MSVQTGPKSKMPGPAKQNSLQNGTESGLKKDAQMFT